MPTKKMKVTSSMDDHCSHQSFIKEFKLGAPTGNYVCALCGQHLSAILRLSNK